ncbi:uncharacterized protein B0H18DRAFT_1120586 [Fomitopsis serialis]|uniref:uncharacterized protein n=1 Tax=Fomitopsis serialis TaxID=139415 RepID=UPI002007A5CF|nr:uncharacterized protein B0H18DRAFT_1120586 [Neoantrodia serialis]KAH9923061.1 hypothetical protein B0H18DRAFT_1120586 [Neoantrodia serialis]
MHLVFSEVTICFGAWETLEGKKPVPDNGNELEDERSSRSFDLLYRIIVDPHFASVIRSMEVHAYKVDGGRGAFEIRCLVIAIGFLRELSSFVWRGQHHYLPSGHRLLGAIMQVAPSSVRAFNSLCSISVSTTWPTYEDTIKDHSFTIARCTTAQENLHTLELPFHSPADVPLKYLPKLTHLGLIVDMQTLNELGSVLRQLPRLRSLSIFLPSSQEDLLVTTLSLLHDDLPHLSSLTLQCHGSRILQVHHTEMLASFLRDRRSLRRLYCNLKVPQECLSLYLNAIRTMKDMEIFDLELTQPFTAEFIENLLSHLPVGLAAMRLTSQRLLSDAAVFSQFWTYFTDLQYLYIRTWEATDVKAEAIIKGTSSLQLLGYNGHLYDVEYPYGKPALLPPWSARKVAFRNAHDFGCEGWEWLMRRLTIKP